MAYYDEAGMSQSDKKKEDWMNSKWRPMMGWMYMMVCMFDFIVAPVLWSLVQAYAHGAVNVQWQPLTLQGAGLFHIAMGAVLGIAAYGRTQEKLNGANNGGMQFPQGAGTTYVPPGGMPGQMNGMGGMGGGFGGGMNSGMGGGFGGGMNSGMGGGGMNSGFGGQSSGGFGSQTGGASTFGAPSAGGFGGSPSGFGSTAPSTPASSGFGGGGFGSTPTTPTPATSGFGSSTPATTASGKKIIPELPQPEL